MNNLVKTVTNMAAQKKRNSVELFEGPTLVYSKESHQAKPFRQFTAFMNQHEYKSGWVKTITAAVKEAGFKVATWDEWPQDKRMVSRWIIEAVEVKEKPDLQSGLL